MRYRLRTLLIALALVPPLLWFAWAKYEAWRVQQEQARVRREWLDRFGMVPPPRELRQAASPLP
jgi:hypothetical protein